MKCKHERISTWFYEDTHKPAMWSCADCSEKFVPFTQLMQEVAKEREDCARIAEKAFPFHCEDLIRARGQT